jgi:protein arginine N-methyltransferase 2
MREQGWFRKKGVKILEGKWQDFMESPELLDLGGFDIVFTDTFAENYQGTYNPNSYGSRGK